MELDNGLSMIISMLLLNTTRCLQCLMCSYRLKIKYPRIKIRRRRKKKKKKKTGNYIYAIASCDHSSWPFLIESSRIINNIAGNGVFRRIEFQRHSIINPYIKILNP